MKIALGCLLVLFLLFFVHTSDSSELMVMQYNENVRIVLSKDKCDKGFKVVAQRIDQAVMHGCWEPKGKMIHIQWEGGDFSDFDVTRFYEVNT
jgi:hypothetical protein